MRSITCGLAMAGVLILAGCAQTMPASRNSVIAANRATAGSAPAKQPSVSRLAAVTENALAGKVVMVNHRARFVVLQFPVGQMPTADQRLQVYRGGLKVGEVKVGRRQRDDNVIADIFEGDCQIGDEVWDR